MSRRLLQRKCFDLRPNGMFGECDGRSAKRAIHSAVSGSDLKRFTDTPTAERAEDQRRCAHGSAARRTNHVPIVARASATPVTDSEIGGWL